jgi:hypothetical protein
VEDVGRDHGRIEKLEAVGRTYKKSLGMVKTWIIEIYIGNEA